MHTFLPFIVVNAISPAPTQQSKLDPMIITDPLPPPSVAATVVTEDLLLQPARTAQRTGSDSGVAFWAPSQARACLGGVLWPIIALLFLGVYYHGSQRGVVVSRGGLCRIFWQLCRQARRVSHGKPSGTLPVEVR